MSVVYKAKHMLLDKLVALKVLQSNRLDSSRDLQRFQQEAQAASSLGHPNIVAVREYGVDEQSHPYIIMDFVDAIPLSEWIKRQPSSPTQALKLACDICLGLEHAHSRGVVHRDIKPDNILVTKSADGSDIAMIADFGIARVTRDDETALRLTQTGELYGSPAHISPEQALGLPADR